MSRRTPLLLALVLTLPLLLLGCEESEVDGTSVIHTTSGGLSLSATYLRPNVPEIVPTMLLLHQPGATNQRNDFDSLWDALILEGYGLVAPDLRSHGLSDSAGGWQDLATDPTGYPEDVIAWLDFIEERSDAGDPVSRDRIGIIGLGTSGSLALAALGTGEVGCAIAASPSIEELDGLGPGFDGFVSGTEGTATVDPAFDLHDVLYLYGDGDEPSATDVVDLADATTDPVDTWSIEGDHHGIEIVIGSDDAKLEIITWCGDKL